MIKMKIIKMNYILIWQAVLETIVFLCFLFSFVSAGNFTLSGQLTGVIYNSLAWGEYDNDGDLDFAV